MCHHHHLHTDSCQGDEILSQMEISARRRVLLLVADGMVGWLENCGNSVCRHAPLPVCFGKRGGGCIGWGEGWEAEIEEDSTLLVI